MIKYKWMSSWSGELQPNLVQIIKQTIKYIKYYPFELKMFYWKYNKKGW